MAAVWITIGTFVLVMLAIAGVWKLRNKVLDPIGPADVSGEAWAYLGCVAAFLTGVASSWLAQGVHARPDVSLLWLWAGLVVGGALAPFVISPMARKIREEQDRRAMADDGIIPPPRRKYPSWVVSLATYFILGFIGLFVIAGIVIAVQIRMEGPGFSGVNTGLAATPWFMGYLASLICLLGARFGVKWYLADRDHKEYDRIIKGQARQALLAERRQSLSQND